MSVICHGDNVEIKLVGIVDGGKAVRMGDEVKCDIGGMRVIATLTELVHDPNPKKKNRDQ